MMTIIFILDFGNITRYRSHDSRDSATGPDCRNGTGRIDERMDKAGNDTANEVKCQKRKSPNDHFNIVAKNPQKQHVANDMHITRMQKHVGEQGILTPHTLNTKAGMAPNCPNRPFNSSIGQLHFNIKRRQDSIQSRGRPL